MQTPSRAEIWKMFDSISQTYDRANRWMTLGLDLHWRKKMSRLVPQKPALQVLDCATGTGDQIVSLCRHCPQIANVIGVDLSQEMLHIAEKKMKKKGLCHKVSLQKACALSMPFANNTFDCVTLSFGIRNVTDVNACLQEIKRCLKPGGKLLIMETSLPSNPLIKKFHLFYIQSILPLIGGWISRKKYAYQYLNQTTQTFPCGQEFCRLLQNSGFIQTQSHPLALGGICIYQAEKDGS